MSDTSINGWKLTSSLGGAILQPESSESKMDLGPYLAFDGVNYECTICERIFSSETALYAHCESTSRHSWCARCRRVFVSTQARNSHLQDSNQHYICPKCPDTQDFESSLELQNHLEESHYFCPDCKLYYNSFEKLQEHDIAQHHLCITCGDYFANKNNLQMVKFQLKYCQKKSINGSANNTLALAPTEASASKHGMLRLLSVLQNYLRDFNSS